MSLNYFSGKIFNLLFNSFEDLDSKSKNNNYNLTLQPNTLTYQGNFYSKFNTTLDNNSTSSKLQLISGRELFNVSNSSNYDLNQFNFKGVTLSTSFSNKSLSSNVVGSNTTSEQSFIPQNLPTHSGLFYLDSLSYQDLNLLSSYKELRSISQNLDSQRDMVNSLR